MMGVHERTDFHALTSGWAECKMRAFYRWEGSTRVEVHVVYDEAGHISAWSVWRNRRVHIDQEAGMRDRLDAFLLRGFSSLDGDDG